MVFPMQQHKYYVVMLITPSVTATNQRMNCFWISELKWKQLLQTWIFCPERTLGDIINAVIAFIVLPVSPRAIHKPSKAEQAIDDQLDKSFTESCGVVNPPWSVAKFNNKSYNGWIKSFGSDLKLSGTWPWITSNNARNPLVHNIGLTLRASAINSNNPFKPAPTIWKALDLECFRTKENSF